MALPVVYRRKLGRDLAGEKIIMALASGVCPREEFVAWVRAHTIPAEGKAT